MDLNASFVSHYSKNQLIASTLNVSAHILSNRKQNQLYSALSVLHSSSTVGCIIFFPNFVRKFLNSLPRLQTSAQRKPSKTNQFLLYYSSSEQLNTESRCLMQQPTPLVGPWSIRIPSRPRSPNFLTSITGNTTGSPDIMSTRFSFALHFSGKSKNWVSVVRQLCLRLGRVIDFSMTTKGNRNHKWFTFVGALNVLMANHSI